MKKTSLAVGVSFVLFQSLAYGGAKPISVGGPPTGRPIGTTPVNPGPGNPVPVTGGPLKHSQCYGITVKFAYGAGQAHDASILTPLVRSTNPNYDKVEVGSKELQQYLFYGAAYTKDQLGKGNPFTANSLTLAWVRLEMQVVDPQSIMYNLKQVNGPENSYFPLTLFPSAQSPGYTPINLQPWNPDAGGREWTLNQYAPQFPDQCLTNAGKADPFCRPYWALLNMTNLRVGSEAVTLVPNNFGGTINLTVGEPATLAITKNGLIGGGGGATCSADFQVNADQYKPR